MNSWKTTLCGLLAVVGAGLTQFFADVPWLFRVGGFLAAVAPAAGLLFARDNNVTSEQAGAAPKRFQSTIPILIAVACLTLAGCAFNRQYATTTSEGTNGLQSVTVAKSVTFAIGDARAIVDKTRATAGKTSSVGASGINEESSSGGVATNAAAMLQLINALK